MRNIDTQKAIEEIRSRKQLTLDEVVQILKQIKKSRPDIFKKEIEPRIKDIDSILDKMKKLKNCNVSNIEKYVRDIAGVRITCCNLNDASIIQRDITNHPHVEKCRVLRTQNEIDADGYIGHHVEVSVKVLYKNKRILDTCEIQIRTLAQDTWAVLSHRDFYKKSKKEISADVMDDMLTLSKLLQCVDRIAQNIKKRLQLETKPLAALSGRPFFSKLRIGQLENADFDKTESLSAKATSLYHKGNISYEREKYKKAIACYEECTALKPDFSEAWFGWALCLYNLHQYDDALQRYLISLAYDRKNPVIYNNLGDVYYRLQDFESAIRQYDAAVVYNPQYLKAFYNRGLAYACIQDYKKAILDFTEVIRLNPSFAEAWHIRGLAYEYRDDQQKAMYDYNKAIELNPSHAEAYMRRAYLRYNLDDQAKSQEDFQKAIEIDPKFPDTYYYLGIIKDKEKKYEDSIQNFSKAIDLNYPDLNYAWFNRGWAYYRSGNYKKAISDFTNAINANYPNLSYAHYSLGLSFHELGNEIGSKKSYLNALRNFDAAIKLNAQYSDALNARGNTRLSLRDFNSAIKDYTASIEAGNPEVWMVYCNRGSARIELKQFDDAAQDFECAIKANRNYPDAHTGFGTLNMRLSKYHDAIRHFTHAIKLEKDIIARAAYFSFRGIAHAYLGKQTAARRDMKTALRDGKETQLYNASCINAVLYKTTGKLQFRSKAFEQLKRISRDRKLMNKTIICNDPNWQHLKNDKLFISIVGRCK